MGSSPLDLGEERVELLLYGFPSMPWIGSEMAYVNAKRIVVM